jgi:hypothetical protein
MLGLAWTVGAIGVVLLVVAAVVPLEGASRTYALACGVVGPLLSVIYLLSPAWRYVVVVDDASLTVKRGEDLRFRLAWTDVREVVVSDATKTCFIDGGAPEKSLLVPGPGAPAPYRIERYAELYAFVVAHVAADRIVRRERLDV